MRFAWAAIESGAAWAASAWAERDGAEPSKSVRRAPPSSRDEAGANDDDDDEDGGAWGGDGGLRRDCAAAPAFDLLRTAPRPRSVGSATTFVSLTRSMGLALAAPISLPLGAFTSNDAAVARGVVGFKEGPPRCLAGIRGGFSFA